MQLTLTSQILSLWAISFFSGLCCAVGRPVPDAGWAGLGLTRDVCLENGLCQNRKKAEEKDTNLIVWYWREECTEKDWQSGKCLNVCVDNVGAFSTFDEGALTIGDRSMAETWQ
jgi:hypothetical protein